MNAWWFVGFIVTIASLMVGAAFLAVVAAEEASRYIHDRERPQ